jgi:hypothetical protein
MALMAVIALMAVVVVAIVMNVMVVTVMILVVVKSAVVVVTVVIVKIGMVVETEMIVVTIVSVFVIDRCRGRISLSLSLSLYRLRYAFNASADTDELARCSWDSMTSQLLVRNPDPDGWIHQHHTCQHSQHKSWKRLMFRRVLYHNMTVAVREHLEESFLTNYKLGMLQVQEGV